MIETVRSKRSLGQATAFRLRVPSGDAGSMLPMIVVCVLLVVMMIMGMTAATAAFIAQQNLQSICDSAATWSAAEADSGKVYTDGVKSERFLPLSEAAVAAAVADHRARFYADDPVLQMAASTDGKALTVACRTRVKIPFGAFFGKGNGIDRETVSVVRSPVSGAKNGAVDNGSGG